MPQQPLDALTDATLLRWLGWARLLTVALLLALIALCLLWELHWAPRPPAWLWALKALPLSLPLGGLLRHRLYTYRWLSLLIWLYLAEAAVHLATGVPPLTWLAATEALLATLVFAVCALYIRLRLYRGQRRADNARPPPAPPRRQ